MDTIAVLGRSLSITPVSYALSCILSGPKAELVKKEYMQHNPCHIFVTRMLTQKYDKSQQRKMAGSCQESSDIYNNRFYFIYAQKRAYLRE
jgi:hypothetical protein